MANKSLYDVYFGDGQSAGQYEASKIEVGDIWSDIDFSRQLGAQKTARRERNLDTILAATQMVSAVAGGMEAKQEYKRQRDEQRFVEGICSKWDLPVGRKRQRQQRKRCVFYLWRNRTFRSRMSKRQPGNTITPGFPERQRQRQK